MTMTLLVKGMSCGGCERAVEGAVRRTPGVLHAKADHKAGAVTIESSDPNLDIETVKANIERVGYKVVER